MGIKHVSRTSMGRANRSKYFQDHYLRNQRVKQTKLDLDLQWNEEVLKKWYSFF